MTREQIAGQRLRTLRGDKSLAYVAAAVGVTRAALNFYELGKRSPRDDVKIRLADFFGTTVNAIFFAEADNNL